MRRIPDFKKDFTLAKFQLSFQVKDSKRNTKVYRLAAIVSHL